MMITVQLAPEVVEAIARRAAEIVLEELHGNGSEGRWLTGARAAASYLGCSPRRVYARLHELPQSKTRGG